MEKNPNEIPMFARFVFFKGLLRYYDIEYLNLNPNGVFHVSVFVHFCVTFVGIKPHWVLFQKFFPSEAKTKYNDPRVVEGAGIHMREDATDPYLSYKLIELNQDLKPK
jgi:preprotein translocase subunit Sec61beta